MSIGLEEIERSEQEKLRLLDLWQFQRKEIESANLQAEEDAALENERLELGTGGVQRGRVPGGTGSDDDDVVNGAHGLIAFRLTGNGVNRS